MKMLEGQVAVVTGGTAGIGKAIALKFAEQGATVIIFGTNPERGAQVVEEISKLTGREGARFYQVDVGQPKQVTEAIKQVLDASGKIDILVNNAGITRDNLLMKMSEIDWDQVIDINLKSCFIACQAVIRSMIKARRGKIINISSVVGLTGNPGQVNYAASKAGMHGLSKALAKEVGARNITCNCIAPGYIKTKMTESLSDDRQKTITEHIPLGRLGMPDDIANVALFLASNLADYVTGQVITVDGGMTM